MSLRPVTFGSALGICLALACSQGTLYHTFVAYPAASPKAAYDCSRTELKNLGYSENAHDDTDFRLVASRVDPKEYRPDVSFRRVLDRLIIEIRPTAEGRTGYRIEAHTIGEYVTQRGQTFVEERASPAVQNDAIRLGKSCGQ